MNSLNIDTNTPEFQQAAQETEVLVQKIKDANGDFAPAYAALESAITEFEDLGYSVDTLIPADGEAGLGFALAQARTGKGFWEIYSRVVRDKLCDTDSELNRLVKTGLSAGTSSIIASIMVTLTLPVAAISIVAAIAAILVVIGLDAYCESTEDDMEIR